MDTHLLQTPQCYGQLLCPKAYPYISSKFNPLHMDTPLIWTLDLKTPSVSVLTGCAILVSQEGGNFLLSGTVYLMI